MSAQLQVHSDPPGIQVSTYVKTRIHIPVDSEVIWGGGEDIWAAEVNLLFKDLPETLILSSAGFSFGSAVMVTIRGRLLGMH